MREPANHICHLFRISMHQEKHLVGLRIYMSMFSSAKEFECTVLLSLNKILWMTIFSYILLFHHDDDSDTSEMLFKLNNLN